jgi:hypothetical protein
LLPDENANYHIVPYHHTNSTGLYYAVEAVGILNSGTLANISGLIQSAYPQQHAQFSASLGYIFTWVLTASELSDNITTLFQVTFAMDNTTNSSFMMVCYDQLGLPSDQLTSYQDTNGISIFFKGSTTESNCDVTGQFIFQLNQLTSI